MIVSGFPGVGKTYCWVHSDAVVDSDSSKFSWLSMGIRDPAFPQNYIEHIRFEVKRRDIDMVLVSSHGVVREALVANDMPFVLVFPEAGLKDEYLQRFRDRGSPDSFVEMLADKWDEFMADLSGQKGCEIIRLKSGEFLSDVLPGLRSPAVKGGVATEAEAWLSLQEREARKLEFPY